MAIDPQNPIVINVSAVKPTSVSDLIRKFGLICFNATNLGAGNQKAVYASDWKTVVTEADDFDNRFCAAYFQANPNGVLYLLECGEVTDETTLETALNEAKGFIDEGTSPVYLYQIGGNVVATEEAAPKYAAFFANYTADGSLQNFGLSFKLSEVLTATLPAESCVFISTEEDATLGKTAGAMVGVMASSSYNISQTNQMTPLQYKRISFLLPLNPTVSDKNSLTEKNVNWIGVFNGENCIMLGKYANGQAWDFRFSTDSFILRAKAFLESRVYNAANVAAARLPYSQRGIDMLLDVVNGQADYCISVGFLTEYGETLADDMATIVNPGSFAAIPFADYIAANPDKYAQEIYDGISGVVRVGRFFRQVVINVTLV